MSLLGALLAAGASAFVIGAAGRFAIPGPDPMPFWLTVVIGFGGSLGGGAIAAAIFGSHDLFSTSSHAFWTIIIEITVAATLVAAYRRFVQRRPLAGPGAYQFPHRGVGIARMRNRLQRHGIDPDRLQLGSGRAVETSPAPEEVARELERLRERRERGELTDEEYEQEREQLRRY
jgi:hypothetical protein